MSQKYRQHGYQDDSSEREKRRSQPKRRSEGPRSPQMPAFHGVRRCAMCGAQLPRSFSDIEVSSRCPKCDGALHTCKNCVYLDPASRFECSQPITERISPKDAQNDCQIFEARTTVEKMTTSGSQTPQDARDAFDDLFKT